MSSFGSSRIFTPHREEKMEKPKILVFASGSAIDGGSGFENLVKASRMPGGDLSADIIGVVSNHEFGGVRQRAEILGVPFIHFPKPWVAECYWKIARQSNADFFALSGWLKRVVGLPPRTTFNIHPGPLPEFGGDGMYGHCVHESVMAAFRRGELTRSAVSMHFVIPEYDRGPTFFRCKVKIREDDTPETLAKRVNQIEHLWQPIITDLVVRGVISWDGINPESLRFPQWYAEECPL